MSQYEGLNLPQLLELMHPLSLPRPVSMVPTTPGWWVLSAWGLATALLCGWYFMKRRQRNRYRRDALAVLAAIEADSQAAPADIAPRVAALLKQTALAAYPRRQVAALYGADWAQFLVRTCDDDPEIARAAAGLSLAAYRPSMDGLALCAPARRWIRLHRA